MQQDGEQAVEHLRTLGKLIFTNSEFRKLLKDVGILGRDVAADAAAKAADAARPSEEQLNQVDETAPSNQVSRPCPRSRSPLLLLTLCFSLINSGLALTEKFVTTLPTFPILDSLPSVNKRRTQRRRLNERRRRSRTRPRVVVRTSPTLPTTLNNNKLVPLLRTSELVLPRTINLPRLDLLSLGDLPTTVNLLTTVELVKVRLPTPAITLSPNLPVDSLPLVETLRVSPTSKSRRARNALKLVRTLDKVKLSKRLAMSRTRFSLLSPTSTRTVPTSNWIVPE